MFVKTEIRESGVYGKALFAAEAIGKGTIVCSFTLGSGVVTEDEYVAAVAESRQPVTRTGTRYAGRYFTFGNEAAPYNFINHSFKPTLLCHCGVVLALHHHVGQQPVVGAARQVGQVVAERHQALQAGGLLGALPMRLRPLRQGEELDAVA